MKNSLKVLLSAGVILCSTSSMAAGLAGARGTLQNIDSAINNAVHKAERMFEENNGKRMRTEFSVVKKGQNPYLSHLSVSKGYKVKIKLAGSAKKGSNTTVPVAKSMLGSEILLIPVYRKGDERITSWECLTNADKNVQKFMGDSGTKKYTASFIRDYTNNTSLSLCTYIDKDLVR